MTASPVRVRFFGTYDAGRHPRIAVLMEGLAAQTHVDEDNVPVPIDTAMRVDALRAPLRVLAFLPMLVPAWIRLLARSRRGARPDVVIVGHLGHLDVLLARVLFPRSRLVLDFLISLEDTARDRGLSGSVGRRVLSWLDFLATRAADDVLVDTYENVETIPPSERHKAVVVPVGASHAWFASSRDREPASRPRLVFFGLFTPLQGAAVIGRALRVLADHGRPFEATMIGTGQDHAITVAAATGVDATWIDWVAPESLPALVAAHDVCLGIFGTGAKAGRVVPNKAYQGAAAGCLVVTSDTPPQRQMLPPDSIFVPAGDPQALATAILDLTPEELTERRARSREHAARHFSPSAIATDLLSHLQAHTAS